MVVVARSVGRWMGGMARTGWAQTGQSATDARAPRTALPAACQPLLRGRTGYDLPAWCDRSRARHVERHIKCHGACRGRGRAEGC